MDGSALSAATEAEAKRLRAFLDALDAWDWSDPEAAAPHAETEAEIATALQSWHWRMFSGRIYHIKAKEDPEDEDSAELCIPFVPNAPQRKFLAGLHTRNIVLKARQLGFCLDPGTRVLTADLRWVRIDDVKPGDALVAVDEDVPGGVGASRKMRATRVKQRWERVEPTYRITFDDGRSVVCTGQHRWLTRSAKDIRSSYMAWRMIDSPTKAKIRVGTQVRWITKPWGEANAEDGWMAGMLDGEGSISNGNGSAGVCVCQREGAVWDRLVAYAESRGYSAKIEGDTAERSAKHGRVPVPKLAFGRLDEMIRLIGQTRPTRFIGNRFWEGRDLPGKKAGTGWATITSIEPLPEQRVIDIETEHGTFIAEGFVSHNSTCIDLMALDHALFNPDQNVGILAQDLDAAGELFGDKVRYAYDRLPEALRRRMPLKKANESQLVFAHNGSKIRVGTSFRSGTIHFLHVSEMGKIAAKNPGRAKEVTTGTLQAVPLGGFSVIESTAEGTSGAFYELTTRAENLAKAGKDLTPADYKFHFFAWHQHPDYRMDPRGVTISAKDHEYFDAIEGLMDTAIGLDQRAWYVAKRDTDFAADPHDMLREYPSTPAECWQASNEGRILFNVIAKARAEGRIGRFPMIKHVPVNTFWDIGATDPTTIWLHQRIDGMDRWCGFRNEVGKSYLEDILWLESQGCVWGSHYVPHDAGHQEKGIESVNSAIFKLRQIRPTWSWVQVPRVGEIMHGIGALRLAFGSYQFDEEACKEGLEHLAAYAWGWSTILQTWTREPRHDAHSHPADAIRQHAQAAHLVTSLQSGKPRPPRRRASALTA